MQRILLGAVIALAVVTAQASQLGISAQDTYAKVQQKNSKVLFIDVRDPVEIMFIGSTEATHVNIPFLLVNRNKFNEQRNIFALEKNENFVAQVKAELAKRGLSEDAEVITMCRSGSERGEPSAKVLRDAGLKNARFVVNGFQGDAIKEGNQAGKRLKNGWQNSGLPWGNKINPNKIYRLNK